MHFLYKLTQSRHLFLILTIVLTLPAIFALTKAGYYNMHDDMQMIRQLEFEKCLKDGQIPCRWTPDLGFGYGYPLFNFYPPMPYLVGQIFRTVGASFVWTVKLTAILQFILAAVFMYLLGNEVFGKKGGLLSSVLYTYAPYHAVNIYVRGAMNEAWAGVFFPLIFLFSKKLINKPSLLYFICFTLSFAGLSLSHNPMVLTFLPFLAVWCIFWLFRHTHQLSIKSIAILVVAGIFSLCLTASFTIPVLVESKLVQIESMFENYYHYSVHFVSLKQIFFSSFWGDGPSIWGPNDGMSFSAGYFHWTISALILLIALVSLARTKKISQKMVIASILSLLGFFAIFMTHNKSTIIWQIFTPVQKIQFPWRFLSHVSFLFSLASGFLVTFFDRSTKFLKKIILPSIVLSIILLNYPYFRPIQSGPLTDEQKFSGLAWQNQITSGIYDYLPKTASTAAKSAAKPIIDATDQKEIPVVSGLKKGTDWSLFNLTLATPTKITLSVLAYPQFKVTDFGVPIDFQIEPELGRMVLNLSSGQHQIYIKLQNTPVRQVSNYISLIASVVMFLLIARYLWTIKPIRTSK